MAELDGRPDDPSSGERLFTGHEIAEFLLRACHDLKAPIRAIRAHAELTGKSHDLVVPGSDHITADPHAEGRLFTVRDDGPSVEAADLERIFQPFVHGLGLAACREIVERHGGRIWAESQPGSGCTFLFTLPAAPV